MPTESLGPFSVSHQDVTTHDISQPDGEINVTDAQIRWQGVDTTETTTSVDDSRNTAPDTVMDADGIKFIDLNVPSVPDGSDFDSYSLFWYYDPTTITESQDFGVDAYFYDKNDNILWEHHASDYEATASPSDSDDVDYLESELESKEYPDAEYVTFQYSGSSTNTGTIEIFSQIRTYYTTTSTTTYSTQDPTVTRDVDGSYTGTPSDGEWSTWEPLNNLTPNGDEEFYHNISGSQKADFEFEYTWEYKYPDAVGGYWNIYDADQNAIHRVALADPADSLLDYNHHRFALGGTTYALDVVDPTDSDAIAWRRWYHPTHGIYCPRATETIQL